MALNIPFNFTHSVVPLIPKNCRIRRRIIDCLPPGGMPSASINSYENFMIQYRDSIMNSNDRLTNKLSKIIEENIQLVYCIVTTRKVIETIHGTREEFQKFIVEYRLDVEVTYGILIYLYTLAQQKIYFSNYNMMTELDFIELKYTGLSDIEIYPDFIVCEFGVSSD